MEPYIDDKGRPNFIPFDPRNGLDFKCVEVNPETNLYEFWEQGIISKKLTLEEFEKLKLLVPPNVRWIIGRHSNVLSYRYHLQMEQEDLKQIKTETQNGLHKG